MVEPLLEGKTLQEAMDQKKIYIEDLSFLENITTTPKVVYLLHLTTSVQPITQLALKNY